MKSTSLKSNMGHLETAGALAGLASMALVQYFVKGIAANAQLRKF